jgi:transglutaminase-like putative cysteine protease
MIRWCASVFAIVASLSFAASAASPSSQPAQRNFQFTYAATISGLHEGQSARVWIPVAADNPEQRVELLKQDLPAPGQIGREAKYGNQILYFQAPADANGSIALSMTYRVTRHETGEEPPASLANGVIDDMWLQPDALVPVGGKSMSLLAGKTLPADQMQLGRLLYDVVDDHMQYRKDKPGFGRGDANWACDSGFGNCTDFHSLFISLARANRLPARFEMGFSVPPTELGKTATIAGYHCWAWFKPAEHSWLPVDISEANKNPAKRDYFFGHLDADRVAFSVGRDLELTPRQQGPAVNFLIYPYVEVDGKPWPAEKVVRKFTAEELTN